MNILVINAGSSSLKFQLNDGDSGDVIIRGHYLEIGDIAAKPSTVRKISVDGRDETATIANSDHGAAIMDMLGILRERGFVKDEGDIAAIGHRIVHGGERFSGATLITPEVLGYIEEISVLAPLHNPVALTCIKALSDPLPRVPHFAVFDTAFHRTIPESVYLYGLPYELYTKFGIRKYGFHGSNHAHIALRASEILGRDSGDLNIITCHLGNGQSVCAVKKGESVDTSMGFTPLEGLPMGTRSGSFDPEIIFFLMKRGYAPEAIQAMINRKSGLLGVSGISSDYKIIEERARAGDAAARRASDILINRIVCLIGSYTAEMGGVDAIVFSGGIGENSAYLRGRVLGHFGYCGLILDAAANERGDEIITAPGSSIRALVVPANEERQIARETARAIVNVSG
ncbi:MAG: acetate/propionate family kinase [Spirochaetes bacterium]|nr:MAG: acetate/propionate family kinase [Spirochaetota bacterium]